MKHKITSIRTLAEHLIANETANATAAASALPAEPVCSKLQPHLATLMGTTGFRALLTRALVRATTKFPMLRIMRVTVTGGLELVPAAAHQGKADDIKSSVALVSELLSLLCAFIGVNLTLQLIREVWPELPIDESNFEPGESE